MTHPSDRGCASASQCRVGLAQRDHFATARHGQAGRRDFNARDSIQIGVPGRVMLVLMRAICVHADAVEARAGNWILTLKRGVVEDKLAVWDQQKRSATTQMQDSEALDLAFLIIADWLSHVEAQ
jgi:hypothetical protein